MESLLPWTGSRSRPPHRIRTPSDRSAGRRPNAGHSPRILSADPGGGRRRRVCCGPPVGAAGAQLRRDLRQLFKRPCSSAAWLRSYRGVPMVWFLHDIITDPAFSSVNRRAALYFARHFATRVAVNSQASADAFIRAGGQAEKVDIVYNGFDPAAAKPHEAARGKALRAELGLDDRPIIGLFGRLSPWKGQHVLLQALANALCPGGDRRRSNVRRGCLCTVDP